MISHLDHLVLTTANEAACIDFYTRVLGMALETFLGGTPPEERRAFRFGNQKLNLHVRGREFEPKAHAPTPGALWTSASSPSSPWRPRWSVCSVASGQSSKGPCCARAHPGEFGRSIFVTPI